MSKTSRSGLSGGGAAWKYLHRLAVCPVRGEYLQVICGPLLDLITLDRCFMSMAALLFSGGDEVILILALFLILLAAKKLPEMAQGFLHGLEEFRRATREVADELADRLNGKRRIERPNHPVLTAVTFILGTLCFALVLYELSR